MPHCEIFREGKWAEIQGSLHLPEDIHSQGFAVTQLQLEGGTRDGVFTKEVEDEFGKTCKSHKKPKFGGIEVNSHPGTSDSIE